MAVNNALHGCQSYSRTFELVSPMQPLKHAKQFTCILHIKAGAVVPYEYLYLIVVSVGTANLDFGSRSHPCELDRIGNEIGKNQHQHGAVSVTDWKGIDFPGNLSTPRRLLDLRDDVLHKLL